MSIPINMTGLDWQMIGAIGTIAAIIVAAVAWRWPRGADLTEVALAIMPFSNTDYPNIHATSGVPSLDQLLAGINLDRKGMRVAMELYASGLAQYNHYLNNLDCVIAESQRVMRELKSDLANDELALAEKVGIGLASGQEKRCKAQSQYEDLAPKVQIYSGHRYRERVAQTAIASALRHNVHRTDFASVKKRIASGDVPLSAVVSELPIMWQDITAMHQKAEYQEPKEKPPKRERIHAIFVTSDMGVLEDKHVERDGNWMSSEKHDFLMPYQKPVPMLRFKDPGKPPVPTGKYVAVVNRKHGIEWDIEFWRRGGYLDSVYERSKKGMMPSQLRKSYLRRQVRKSVFLAACALWAVNIILWAFRFLA